MTACPICGRTTRHSHGPADLQAMARKRGRPPSTIGRGRDAGKVTLRFAPSELDDLDQWRKVSGLSRAEHLRHFGWRPGR